MQLSETIVAALIGAVATVCTALFQIFNVLRSKNATEPRPKRTKNALRSVLSVAVLMLASGAGGFLYAELRREHEAKDLRAVGDKLNEQSQILAALKERLEKSRAEISTPSPSTAQEPAAMAESII